jgi:hypothetical protein
MDRVAADLERAWNEVESELRTIALQLDDELFRARAKPHELEDLERRRARALERRQWIEENRARAQTTTAGTLPSPQTGLWQPLFLAEREEPPADEPPESESSPSRPLAVQAGHASSAAITALRRELAELVTRDASRETWDDVLSDAYPRFSEYETLRLIAIGAELFGSRSVRRAIRKHFNALRHRLLDDPDQRSTPEVDALPSLIAGVERHDGLAPQERPVLTALWQLGLNSRSVPQPVAVLIREIESTRIPVQLEALDGILRTLSDTTMSPYALIENKSGTVRLSALGDELFTTKGSFRALPIPLVLLRGLDGVPPHVMSELVQAARGELMLGTMQSFVQGPDWPWGGRQAFLPNGLYGWATGDVGVKATLAVEIESESGRARVRITELPPQLSAAKLITNIQKAVVPPGVLSLEEVERGVIAELDHPLTAIWFTHVVERHASHAVRWRTSIPASLPQLVRGALDRCIKVVMEPREKEWTRLRERLEAIEGRAVFLTLGDTGLQFLREAFTSHEAQSALRCLASPKLRELESYCRHELLPSARLLAEGDRFITELNERRPLRSAVRAHDFVEGFSEAQARAIDTTKWKGLTRDALLREAFGVLDELAQREDPDWGLEDAKQEILLELDALLKKFPRVRRTRV